MLVSKPRPIKMSTVLLYTIVFVIYSICEITGALPQEAVSAGLTLPSLFSRYYGYEVDYNYAYTIILYLML